MTKMRSKYSGSMPMPLSLDGEVPAALFAVRPRCATRAAFAAELDGVADQVLEELDELRRVRQHGRQGSVS